MSKHYNRILELKLRLLEESGEKACLVPHVEQKNDESDLDYRSPDHPHFRKSNI